MAPAYAVLPLDTFLQRYEGAIGLFRVEDPDTLPQLQRMVTGVFLALWMSFLAPLVDEEVLMPQRVHWLFTAMFLDALWMAIGQVLNLALGVGEEHRE